MVWNNNRDRFTKKDIEYIINSFINVIKRELKNDREVKIEGFGTLSTYTKKSYMGKDLEGNTKEKSSTKCISFKPSKKLKE